MGIRIIVKFDGQQYFEVTAYDIFNKEVGYISFVIEEKGRFKNWCRACNVKVDPYYQNQGIATKMYKRAFKWILRKGYNGIYSNPSLRVSDWTDKIWERIGTGKIGRFDIIQKIN